MLSITTIDNEIKEIKGKKVWEAIKKPIIRMSLQINEKQAVVLEGFESYLTCKDMEHGVLNSKFHGVRKIYLFGKYNGKVAVFEIDYKTGKRKNYIVEDGKEYKSKIMKEYWKRGVTSKPHVYFKD